MSSEYFCNFNYSEDGEEEERLKDIRSKLFVRHPLIPSYDRNSFLIEKLWEMLGIEFPDVIMNTIDEFCSFNIADIALYGPNEHMIRDNMFFYHTSVSFWCKPYNPGRGSTLLKGTLCDSRTKIPLCGWNFTCDAIGVVDFTLVGGAIKYSIRSSKPRRKRMAAFDEWTHICGTYNPISQTKVLYINGVVSNVEKVSITSCSYSSGYVFAKQELEKLRFLRWDESKVGTMKVDNSLVEKIADRISNVSIYSDSLSLEKVRILSKNTSWLEKGKKMALKSVDGLQLQDGYVSVGCGPHWKADGLDLMIEIEA